MPFWKKAPASLTDIRDVETVNDLSASPADGTDAAPYKRSKAETKYLLKLDACFLMFCLVSQIIKYLDQQNINFAYSAGMKEDLALYGKELNYFTTYFNVGYCIFIIPSQILITWFRPCWYLSSLEFIWGVLTFCYAACHSAKGIYAIRALVGIAESSAYPGAITLLMSWYTPTELAKRIGFYHSAQAMGGLLAGALQSAIFKTLDGRAGLAGWRWAFIINGLMTVVVAALGLFMIPDYPDRPNRLSFWLNADDKAIAEDRLGRTKRKTPYKADLRAAKRVLFNPMTYHLALIYIGFLLTGYGSNYFNLFLKSLKNPDGSRVWTTEALSAVPIGGYAINIALSIGLASVTDLIRKRWPVLLGMSVFGIPPLVILTIWNVPVSAKYYAYFMLFVLQTASPMIWSWMSDMLPRDAEQRSMIIGVCIAFYYATNAWANPLIYPASQAPHYVQGWPAMLGLVILSGFTVISLAILDNRVYKPRNARILAEEEEQSREAADREGMEGDGLDVDKQGTSVAVQARVA